MTAHSLLQGISRIVFYFSRIVRLEIQIYDALRSVELQSFAGGKFTALHEKTRRVTISDSKRNSVSVLNVPTDDL